MIKNRQSALPLGLYLHIPFCVRKCLYCDFLSFPAHEETREKYVQALLAEIRAQSVLYESYEVQTVFFGGGTPSLLSGAQLGRIMEELRRDFSFARETEPEITMEANPGTLSAEKLGAYRQAGVNRLSIGLQSAHNDELRALGRIHTWEDFLASWEMARAAGFENLNVDLMSALPGQSPETWMDTLSCAAGLSPEHISAYSLIVEEGTPFYERYGEDGKKLSPDWPPLPDEEADRVMYEKTGEYLADLGYRRYEISNYARPGYECRHNLSYWQRRDYAGFGLGAASLRRNVRWKNTGELSEYLEKAGETEKAECLGSAGETEKAECLGNTGCPGPGSPLKREIQILSRQEQMEEFMFLGLRVTEGISCQRFEQTFGVPVRQVYGPAIDKLTGEGLLSGVFRDTGRGREEFLKLTDYGVDVSNYALAEFLF